LTPQATFQSDFTPIVLVYYYSFKIG